MEPDLSQFDGIVPCGIHEAGVTSLVDLGLPVAMEDVDMALQAAFEEVFGVAAEGRSDSETPLNYIASQPR